MSERFRGSSRTAMALVALFLVVTGCGSGGAPSTSTTTSPSSSGTTGSSSSTIVDEPSDRPVLVAVGTSFGMCAGPCNSRLTLEDAGGARFRWTATDHDGTLHGVASGALAASAQARLDALLADLTDLDEVYGCPDCADGGAALVELDPGGVSTYPLGQPPEVLRALDRWGSELLAAVSTCEERGLVVLDAGCVPAGREPIDAPDATATR